jgi:hypothetical protein
MTAGTRCGLNERMFASGAQRMPTLWYPYAVGVVGITGLRSIKEDPTWAQQTG